MSMIFDLPNFSAIAKGLGYGWQLALKQTDPSDDAPHPATSRAIIQALWFKAIIAMVNTSISVPFEHLLTLMTLLLIIIVDTLAYPVISHQVLRRIELEERFPRFITAYTWLGNLRVLMVLGLIFLSSVAPRVMILVVPISLWMLWAAWFVASKSLGRGGWLGAGMVGLAILLELLLTLITISIINPEFAL